MKIENGVLVCRASDNIGQVEISRADSEIERLTRMGGVWRKSYARALRDENGEADLFAGYVWIYRERVK